MAVPGRAVPEGAPDDLARTEPFAVDAYQRSFDAAVADVDREQNRVLLGRTAFYPGAVASRTTSAPDLGRRRRPGREGGPGPRHRPDLALARPEDDLPSPGTEVAGELDWERRHLTMRTHTALHILCGVIWADHRVAVTGGNMDPGKAASTSRWSRCPRSSAARSRPGSTRRSPPRGRSSRSSWAARSPTRTTR